MVRVPALCRMSPKLRARVIRNAQLSTAARFLWTLLETYADRNGTNCFPSTETLCEDSGHDRKWVFKHLNELETACLIRRDKREGKRGWSANSYVLNTYPKAEHINGDSICTTFGTAICPQKRNTTISNDQNRSASKPPKRSRFSKLTGLHIPSREPLDLS